MRIGNTSGVDGEFSAFNDIGRRLARIVVEGRGDARPTSCA